MRISRFILASVLLAAPSLAQNSWLPLGTNVSDGSMAQELTNVAFGFPFTMPGGTVVNYLVADRYGRLLEDNPWIYSVPGTPQQMAGYSAPPTFSSSIHARAGGDFTDPNAGVWFYTDSATVAAVTWTKIRFGSAAGTFQVQLFADGRIRILYDSLCFGGGLDLVGVCPGFGVTLPPATALRASTTTGPFVTSDPTVYQYGELLLASYALEFVPSGAGGVAGWTVNGFDGIPDPLLPFAENRSRRAGCFARTSYTFVPNAVGGYDVSAGPSQYEPSVGTLAGATEDDLITAVGLDLGFPMLFPDGNSYQFVDVDPNGRLVPTGLAGANGDFSPSVLNITTDGYPYFFGMWSDWNVTELASDGIYFRTDPGSATFTWRDVAQYGPGWMPPCTWQIRLLQGGTVIITHEDLAGMNPPGVALQNAAVGLTSGVLPDPGEIDMSALTSTPQVVPGYAYEWWDCAGQPPVEALDLKIDTADLVGVTRPILGTTWELQVQDVGAATFGFYVLGLSATNSSLEPFGSPCTRAVALDFTEFRLADGLGNLQPWTVSIPNNAALTGFRIYGQAAVEQPIGGAFAGFLGLPFATAWTNAIRGTVGQP